MTYRKVSTHLQFHLENDMNFVCPIHRYVQSFFSRFSIVGLVDMRWRYNLRKNKITGRMDKVTVLRNLTLILKNPAEGQITTSQDWWIVEEDCQEFKVKEDKIQDLPKGDYCQHLNLYTFNEKAFPPTLSFISGGG